MFPSPSSPSPRAVACLLLAASLLAACEKGGGGGEPPVDGTGTVTPASGGTVSLAGGPTVVVPAGAVATDLEVTIRKASVAKPPGTLGEVYEFLPAGTAFSVPVEVGFPVPAGTTSATASVYWSKAAGGGYDVVAGTFGGATAVAEVTHFSLGFVASACTPGAACTPANACHVGATACDTGAPVCADTAAPVEDGTGCGGTDVCTAGACGPPPPATRPVTGTLVSALVRDGAGYQAFPGTVDPATGALSIPGVPAGRYLLAVDGLPAGGRYVATEQEASLLDLSVQVAGRPDAVPTVNPPEVTYQLSGLVPWSSPGDFVELIGTVSWEVPFGPYWGSPDLAPGATEGTSTRTWGSLGARYLADTSQGDALWLLQATTHTIPAGEPGEGLVYVSAAASAQVTDLVLADGVPATLAAELLPAGEHRTVSGQLRLSEFEALLADAGPGATPSLNELYVGAWAHGVAHPIAVGFTYPDLFILDLEPGTPDFDLGARTFGRVLGPSWQEFQLLWAGAVVPTRASGASAPTLFTASVSIAYPLDDAPDVLAPVVGPPLSPAIDGLSLAVPRTGLGPAPTLSFSAPAVGSPTSYLVELWRLSRVGTSTRRARAATFTLYPPPPASGPIALALPAGLLEEATEYVAVITAREAPWDTVGAPAGFGYPQHLGSTVTAPFSRSLP